MNRSFRFGADGESSFRVLWEDGECMLCRGRRLGPDGKWNGVLAVLPAAEHPQPSGLDRLTHEYGLKDELDDAWAVRPMELVRDGRQTMLLLEDPGGEPLAQLLGTPMDVGRFLRLAISIATALGNVHRRGLVHKDIKPANILVTGGDGEVRFTGFGLASRLPRERQAPEQPETIAGTLAYMAPEQTGRMNRSIDSRSDLYSLGVTFYQMLTGALPFAAAHPMELVHCHIARRPVPPGERRKKVPEVVSTIVMKLLAKAAEERYQTAAGLESDLRRCLAQLEAQNRIDDFPLGAHDTPDWLLIPEKLYGREREIGLLHAALDRVVKNGTPELVLVSGYAGIGKSSVVNELHRVLVSPSGLFASGKFDQYKRDMPYSTLAQAFQNLIRRLLTKTEADLASWRESLREAMGQNGQLIIELVPELKAIIGEQPQVQELPPQEAQRRFHVVLRRFVGVFARREHPLALFLDDLQWLDAATLELIEDLLTRSDLQHLLLIGAYRDSEVDPSDPLMQKLEEIRAVGGRAHEIRLAPLAEKDVTQLITDTLHCTEELATPLALLVHEKTAGNPFFINQFLHALSAENSVAFDHDTARWSWDLDRIRAKGFTDNVVDLMAGKLQRLSTDAQKALRQLACLGNAVPAQTLSLIIGKSDEEIRSDLWEAVRLELVEHVGGSYKFTHDRIQEAAYSLVPEDLRAREHLRIGRLFAAHLAADQREAAIFDVVNHLNRGVALITSPKEREQLAWLNLAAGKRAKISTAYASALTYLNVGASLSPTNSWDRGHELMFQLELYRAECEFLTGKLSEADERLATIWHHAANTVERATVACLRVDLYMALDQASKAIAVGLDYLREVGVEWLPHPSDENVRHEYDRLWSQLADRTIEELIDLPLMTDTESLATLDVLIRIVPPAVLTSGNLASLVMCRAVNLSLEQGNCDASCYAYAQLATVLGPHFGDYRTGYRFARLGYDLIEQRGLTRFQARTYLQYGYLSAWTKHVLAGRDLIRRAFEVAHQTGDLTNAAYSCDHLNANMLAVGDPLSAAQREAENGLAFARKARIGFVIDIIAAQLGLIRTLRGVSHKFGSLEHEQLDEVLAERRFSENPDLAIAECWYWVRKLQARFFAGDYTAAIEAGQRAQRLLWTSPGQFETAEFHFYAALSCAAACGPTSATERQRGALAAHHRQLEVWAENCSENFENRAALVGAEIARIEGRELDAERLYEKAIRSSRTNGFVHNEAIAYERAAAFYLARELDEFAETYLRKARTCYARWGAVAKVQQLDQLYPHLAQTGSPAAQTGTIGAGIEHLDLATVISVSQTISGEIVLEKLLDVLMRTAIEHAGAERGVLIRSQGVQPRIVAEATTGDTIVVQLRDEPVTAAALPEEVVNYVVRTNESVILDDAAAQNPFSADPYIGRLHARSLLCLPLLNQGHLTGVLYLENNLAPRVFAPGRIAVLKLLASQAASALENVQLYRDLQQREATIRRLVSANIIGIFFWNLDGRIVDANDALLRMLGFDRSDLIAGRMRWTELTPPDWLERDTRALEEADATGVIQPYEKDYFRKDGSRIPVLLGAATFDQGRTQGVAFVLDLTESKRAEAALRDSEEQWKAVFENNPVMYFMVDTAGTIVSVNPFGAEQLGYLTGELIGRPVEDVFHEADREAVRKNAAVCFEQPGRAMSWELRKIRKSGEVIWVRETARVSVIKDRLALLIVCEDITEGRRAADALREVQAELAHANRLAAMGQLTASIAHEVNQPIGAMVTDAQAALRFLEGRPPDLGEVRDALASIVRGGFRAGDVIDRIRALIKKAPPRREPVDMNEAIREVIVVTRGEAAKHGISVEAQLADRLPLIQGDLVQLQQVVLNLVLNAIEAMAGDDQGPRELLIKSASPGSDSVIVAVQDSGPGLDAASPSTVFEPFHTTKPDGLGIGLSISRSIVEAHGGKLAVTANVPRGAVFQFTLPARGYGT